MALNKFSFKQVLASSALNAIVDAVNALETALSGKVTAVAGKVLSSNDFTDEDKAKLSSALTQHQDISGKVDKVDGKGLSSNDFTDELKTKLSNAITQHQDISGKVDKVEGKGLSTNDYTTEEKQKLSAIEGWVKKPTVTTEWNTNPVDNTIYNLGEKSELTIESLPETNDCGITIYVTATESGMALTLPGEYKYVGNAVAESYSSVSLCIVIIDGLVNVQEIKMKS